MDFTEQHKEELERKIVEVVIAALENNNLSENDLPLIASFVLERIDNIKTQEELMSFLTELTSKWKIFENIKDVEAGEVREKKEDTVLTNVLDMAKSGQIEEAIRLAKSVTEK